MAFGDIDHDLAVLRIMYERIFQQVGDECRGKRFVHEDVQRRMFGQDDGDVTVGINLLKILQQCFDLLPDTEKGAFGKLPVVDLRKEEQRLVQARSLTDRLLGLDDFAQLFFGQRRTVGENFETVLADGKGRLKLVRGIADKLFLQFESGFGAFGVSCHRFVEPAELLHVGIVLQRFVFRSDRVRIEPVKERVQRSHAAIIDPYVDCQNRYQ